MATLHYFVHGRGRGHASRARDAVPALRAAGHEVRVFAGGAARDALAGVVVAEPRAVVARGLAGLSTWARLYRGDVGRARVTRPPDLVISDGDVPSLAAARRLGLPRIAVGHDLVFAVASLPAGLPRWPLARERAHASLAAGLAEHPVAVHFLPSRAVTPGAHLARIDARDLEGDVTDGGFFLSYFRDANADAVLDAVVAAGAEVVCFGTETPRRRGVDVRPFDRASLVEHLRGCRGVVGSSGSNLLAESVWLGKPVLAVHRRDEAEQTLNAALAEAADVGMRLPIGGGRTRTIDARRAARFVDRARRRDFARVDLAGGLEPLPEVLVRLVAARLG